jgi:hypothetical protein
MQPAAPPIIRYEFALWGVRGRQSHRMRRCTGIVHTTEELGPLSNLAQSAGWEHTEVRTRQVVDGEVGPWEPYF